MTTLPAGGPGCNGTGRPARRPRIRRPDQAAPPPADTTAPYPCPACARVEAEREAVALADHAARMARYEVLVGTEANRIGHQIIATADRLLDLLDRFQAAAGSHEAYQRLRRAGLVPDAGEEYGPDHFEDAAEDSRGMTWALHVFRDLFRSGLVRDPSQPGPRARRRR